MIKTAQYQLSNDKWEILSEQVNAPQLILLFGSRPKIETNGIDAVKFFKNKFPSTIVVTVSTAGNIIGSEVKFNNLTATAIQFDKTQIVVQSTPIKGLLQGDEKKLGQEIASQFNHDNLKSVLLFTTAQINAGELVEGINDEFKNTTVSVSGGVSGDGVRFEKTLVGIDENILEHHVVAIGLYSKNLIVSHGSKGGWTPFGPPRKVTKANQNVLYEIDNQPVLGLYKEYLGAKAKDLPGSGLLFPFAIIDAETDELIVRGIQGIDEETQSIILYGNVQKGQTIRLMRANHSVLIDGAGESANDAIININIQPQLAILVSCVARRLALNQLIEEELEEVKEALGNDTTLCGFYSYSEFSPLKGTTSCSLHNQTMTITVLAEN